MGTGERLSFEAAGAALLPEELSAAVIASLLADVRDAAGFEPRAAVISTPALFELPQNHATARAGRLAGLEEVVLIQEPIASAIAAGWRADHEGTWLVFDLGGGTLDVSLLETAEGRLRVLDHSGDNFLGGKDIDGALCEWAAAALARRDGFEIDRATARGRRTLARLRVACEQAKIELSRAERATIVADGDGGGGSELEISRDQLDALTEPFIARGLTAVRNLLAKNQRTADEVARVVLVGGPTLMPGLRARIGDLFDGRIAAGIDPMTIVARGAALYAGSVGLDATPAARASAPAPGLAVRIEHPSVTADLEPFVVGRCLPAVGQTMPDRVRVERGGRPLSTVWIGEARTCRLSVGRKLRSSGAPGAEPPQPLPRAGVRPRPRRGRAGDARVRDRARRVDRRSAAGAHHRRRPRRRFDARLLRERDAAARSTDVRPPHREGDRGGQR